MPLITASDLTKFYGSVELFSRLSLSIPQRARIGLVGSNGVGKTTLLRLLVGLEEPSAGEVQRARGLRVGYLPQEASLPEGGTLWQVCLAAFSQLLERQAELARLEAAMSDPQQADAALEAYGRLQHAFEHQGGYTYETRIRQVLSGLGFTQNDEQRPVEQLSGGQRTRALLAQLLLTDPDLLLLDEPTNHLDIAAIEWLEDYLRDWQGAALVVSHDRYFLDQVATSIWEMSPGLEEYRGNYSAYLSQSAERRQRRLEELQAQQDFIAREEEYIRRNIAGQNTRQAQGRRKRLERLQEETPAQQQRKNRRLSLRLDSSGRSGDIVLRTRGLSVGYADEGRPLFEAPDLTLTRGECAALIGPNGAGKTTLLKTLLGQIPPFAGEVELGASLQIGYFAQAHEGLHAELDLMQEISAAAPVMRPAEIRDFLARFLFTGDDVFKKVEVLSGGERGRLALACLALQGANLLLLDEPTNHLDLPSQEVLQSILRDYSGTILLVSHDRYLIDALASQVWEVLPGEQSLRIFAGSYSEYKAARQAEATAKSAQASPDVSAPGQAPAAARSEPSKMEQRRRQQRIEALEQEITSLETQLAEVTRLLEQPSADLDRVRRLGREYTRLHNLLEDRLEEWGQVNA